MLLALFIDLFLFTLFVIVLFWVGAVALDLSAFLYWKLRTLKGRQ